MSVADFTLRPYAAADEDAAIELWRRSWQQAYPHIDFSARAGWWRTRWNNELVPQAVVTVACAGGAIIGFVTVDPRNGYLDQIVVAPDWWGRGAAQALLDEARRISPAKLELHVNTDNARAIRFYQKHGFQVTGADVNPNSGAPVHRMNWTPE